MIRGLILGSSIAGYENLKGLWGCLKKKKKKRMSMMISHTCLEVGIVIDLMYSEVCFTTIEKKEELAGRVEGTTLALCGRLDWLATKCNWCE